MRKYFYIGITLEEKSLECSLRAFDNDTRSIVGFLAFFGLFSSQEAAWCILKLTSIKPKYYSITNFEEVNRLQYNIFGTCIGMGSMKDNFVFSLQIDYLA